MKNIIKNFIYGFLFGTANAIPGISGGTIAVVLDFYDRLVSCITLNFKKIFENIDFILPLAIGIFSGMVGSANLMGLLLEKYPCQTYFGFIGVVFGSIPLIYKKATSKEKINKAGIIAFVIASIIMIALSIANPQTSTIKYTTLSVESFIIVFLTLLLGSITMMIPGVSGSLVLAIIGMYETIYVEIIGGLNIPLLIPAALGGAVGMLGGSKLINYLLSNYIQQSFMSILGLLVFSTIPLFNYANVFKVDSFTIITSIIVMIVMIVVTYMFSKKDEGK